MKYCDEFAALLDPYIDGELSPEETARVREHLRSCDGCRAYVQAALIMRDAFPEAEDTEVPEGFAEGVMAAIRADAAPRKRRSPRWKKTLLPLAACCAVVVLAVSSLPRLSDTAVEGDVTAAQTERQIPADAAASAEDSGAEDSASPTEEDGTGLAEAAESGDPTATAGAAPETYAIAPAAQEESEPDADAKTSIVSQGKTAVEETEEPAAPETYAIQTAPALTLTAAEAGTLLDGYTPTPQEDGTLAYELTASEYTELLEQLEQQGMTVAGAATAQEAETAGTVWVYVIPE